MRNRNRIFHILFSLILIVSLFQTSLVQADTGPTTQPTPSAIAPAGAATRILLPYIPNGFGNGSSLSDWATVAGNPQRTSMSAEQVTGNLKVTWYRPIEAYIPQNAQIIAAYGLIFVATARGLYALNADNGSEAWRFDTEMPVGNSPTVSNGVVYVAGYDRKVHALNAMNGTQLWEFTGAQDGYEANPLVVENMVILGNRDGNLYAIGAYRSGRDGQLIWKYATGGPIHQTAAYKNGVVYVASGDMYAYAVTTNGALKWKSAKMPGDGMQSYWPVIFTNPTTGQDMVVFSSALGYRNESGPGTYSIDCKSYDAGDPTMYPCDSFRFYYEDIFYDRLNNPDAVIGNQVTVNEPWAQGKTIYQFSRLAEYLENNPNKDAHLHKPWRRVYIVLNTSDGKEFTMDSDKDGNPEYAPLFAFTTKSGNVYPPVAAPDGLLYFSNVFQSSWQGRVMGWRVGTSYFAVSPLQGAGDEPQALSGGGKAIYRSICCDRVGDWFDINNPGNHSFFWHYAKTLLDQAPGYDQMWWFSDPNVLDRLLGNYGDANGVYHNHGDQNPIVPYNGRVYIHRSNAVIAFGPDTGPGKLPLLRASAVSQAEATPTVSELKDRLSTEISKMIRAGHLRPGYYNHSQFSIYHEFDDYFSNPGDTLYALTRAFPYVNATVQQQLRSYLKTEFNSYFDPVMYSNIGWIDGAARESTILPPEVDADRQNYPKQVNAGPAWTWTYPQYNFYAMWKYAEIFPEDAGRVYDLALDKLQVPVPAAATNQKFATEPWELNGYIAGYIGFLNLQKKAGRDGSDGAVRTQVTNELNRLEQLRVSTFTKDSPYTSPQQINSMRTLNVARNFILLVPELGDFLNKNALSKVQTAMTEYNWVAPYWFVSRYNGAIGESAMQNLYDYNALFQAQAYIMKLPYDQLTKYLDAPAFERGDLFYIQNLVAALEAPSPRVSIVVTGLDLTAQNSSQDFIFVRKPSMVER